MITPFSALQQIRGLIWQPAVRALVTGVYTGEIALTEFDRATAAKEKFIAINFLTTDFAQVQTGVLNMNIYCPDVSGIADGESLDAVLLAVKPLLEDAYTNDLNTELGTLTELKLDDKKYTVYNQRINVYAPNLL
ncbi:hypothetical protein LL912_00890 [Niabella sp. CC-SYL272]|uniref:hypothetical protein n=1 Tax=Niabella agricola TaxID=2891571 RepID=UPI001F379C6D|nr:hypothetical protein [Niabella agricola]MCF3107323.1 hypothetical protein [Niabella agricola]